MGKTYRQVGGTERRLAKNMRKLNVTWDVIQKVMERSPDTLNNIINPSTSTPKITGRPKKIPVKMLLCIVSHMLCHSSADARRADQDRTRSCAEACK